MFYLRNFSLEKGRARCNGKSPRKSCYSPKSDPPIQGVMAQAAVKQLDLVDWGWALVDRAEGGMARRLPTVIAV